MKKRRIAIFMGLFLSAILVAALAGILLMRGGEKTKKPETVTETEIRETEVVQEPATEGTDGSCTFLSLGNIYYLLPEEEAKFKDQVRDFLKENGIEADTVTALGKVEDDKASPKGTAQFYLQIDDADRSVLQVRYEKETGKFSIAPYEETIGDIEDYGGMKQPDGTATEASSEYSAQGTEPIDFGLPQITDPDGELSSMGDMETLQNNLLLFLNENLEERRLFYVSSFEKTETGYDVVLEFETSRIDGQSIEVKYSDGKYEFRWR